MAFRVSVADRADLGGTLGLLAGMVGATIAWIEGIGVASVLISVGIGALLSYWVVTKTQKNLWRREAALRKVDEPR